MLTELLKASNNTVKLTDKGVDRAADALSATPIGAVIINWLIEFNVILETLTLATGIVAGVFALLFHYRRWRNEEERFADEVAEEVVHKIEEHEHEREED